MKIVIEIDDEQVLFDIKNRGLEAETETDKVIINALYSGTPLPKGHGRLIDADDFFCEYPELAQEPYIHAPTVIEADKAESEDKNGI
jgi:hypothetical protein